MHIFGDILKQRFKRQTYRSLQDMNEQAKHDFKMLMGTGVASKEASKRVGSAMMDKMIDLLSTVHFDIAQTAYCYKCRSQCPVHPMPFIESADATTIAIAGSTCTSWSSVGRKGRWVASSAMVFVDMGFRDIGGGAGHHLARMHTSV